MFMHAHEQGRKNKAPLLMLLLLRESEREDEERGEGWRASERVEMKVKSNVTEEREA